MSVLTVGSLFAGIGGIELGLERTGGFRAVWQVEKDAFARRVLEKHWPGVRRWDDVRTFPPEPWEDWGCDLICGGFPCQDISHAGRRAGMAGARSGLWSEFARTVRALRPRYVLVENVAALLVRGLDVVLGDLAACGYDAEWSVLSACSVGAPHARERVFVIAHADRFRRQAVAHEGRLCPASRHEGDAGHLGPMGRASFRPEPRPLGARPVGVGDGFPFELDRIGRLGNAVVPQVAEWLGRRILALRDGGAL